MAESSRRFRKSTSRGIAASSAIALALGGISVVGPGPLASQATAAEFTGGIRDKSGAVEEDNQMASDLPAGSCVVDGKPNYGSQAGFTWNTLEPSATSDDKTLWGLSLSFDNSKDRTFADWSFGRTANLRDVLDAGEVPSMNVGQTFLDESVTHKADESIAIENIGRVQTNLNLWADLTDAEVEQFASATADNPVRYAWQGHYKKDNDGGPKATQGDSAEFSAVVNPWPSENIECNPITVSWEDWEQHVIVPGEETKVGHIDVPELQGDGEDTDDSLSRMVVEAYDGNGKFIGTTDPKASGGEKNLRIDEATGEIFFTWPEYRDTDLASDKNVNFSVLAKPRSDDQLQAAVEHNNYGEGKAFDSSNSLTRYNTPNVIDSKAFSLDDTEYYDPQYDPREQHITSGVEGNAPTEERQTVTFTNVADSNGDTLADLVEKYHAQIDLDDANVYEGWDAKFQDPENGDYTVVVESPAGTDARPGTFAQPIVKVTYSNGSQDIIPLLVIVDPNNTQTTEVIYPPETIRGLIGEQMTSEAPTLKRVIGKNQAPVKPASYTVDPGTVPAGWTIDVASDGTVTATSPVDAKPGDLARPKIVATYPDGTIDERELTFLVGDDASLNNPSYPVEVTKPSVAVTHQIQNAPEGSTFTLDNDELDGWTYSINPDTGAVTVTPPADAQGGDRKTNTVTVTYPDGTTDVVPVDTVVAHSFNYEAEPNYPAELSYPGEQVKSPLSVDKPDEVGFDPENPFVIEPGANFTATGENNEFGNPIYTVSTPNGEWTVSLDDEGNVISQIPETAEDGDSVSVPVKVTYEDGSSDDVTAVVNVKQPTRPIPFDVEYVYDATIPAGTYEVETEGKPGEEKQKKDGTWEQSKAPVNEVVRVGTKPAENTQNLSWTAPIPYSTTTRPNPELAPGETRVVQNGVNGERNYTATFRSVGDESYLVTSEDAKQPVEEIIEYGPTIDDQTLTSTTTNPVPFNTTFAADPNLPAGEQVVEKQGENGVDTITSSQEIKDGKPVGKPTITTERTKEPVDAVVRVGTKTTGENVNSYEAAIPFPVRVVYDPSLAPGESKVTQEGKPGTKKVTITQPVVNSAPNGEATVAEETVTEPTEQIVTVGTKPDEATNTASWSAQVPFKTVVRPNPDLKPGEVKTVQEGEYGEKKFTADFSSVGSDSKVDTKEEQTKAPKDQIIEYGPTIDDQTLTSTTTRPIEFVTEYVLDETLPAGEQVVDKQGENGVDTITATQEIKDGKPVGEPKLTTERTKEPVDAVVRVGTKTTGETANTVTAEVPFGVKIEFDPEMPAGTSETVTEGKPGTKTTTVTQKVTNSNPEGEPQITEEITDPPVDQVIKVGTKPSEASENVTWKAPIPFEVETRPNPELKPGEVKVAQKGVPGEKTYTADFTAKGDQATVTPEEKQTKDPVKEIIEYGPAAEDTTVVTKVEKPVPFETEIIFDNTLKEGEQKVDQQGQTGTEVVTSTQKIVDGKPSGDPEVKTERTKEPTKQIIRVGTKTEGTHTTSYEKDVPFETEIIFDENLEAGKQETVQEGKLGKDKVTTTQTIVNSEVTDTKTETERVTDPVKKIVKVGTKGKPASTKIEWTENTPFEVEVRVNPSLKPGETKVVQEGKPGEVKHTVGVEVDDKGNVTKGEPTKETVREPVKQIIEVGPATEHQTELTDKHTENTAYDTIIEYDPNLEVGKVVEDQAGVYGEKEITKTWKLKNGEPVGDPEVSEKVLKDPQPRKIRVGTKCNCDKPTPENPTDPEDPTDPGDSGKPEDPADPGKPEDPSDPEEPGQPEDPTDPVDPTDPGKPEDPSNPEDPTDPGNPEDPANPEDPTDPGKPEAPSNPSNPGGTPGDEGGSTGSPSKPSKPGMPLPRTGAEIAATAGLAALLVLGGVAAIAWRRRSNSRK